MNPTNKPLAIDLDGKRQTMFFDLNTFERFERETGKHFFEFVADLQNAAKPIIAKTAARQVPNAEEDANDMMEFLRHVAARDLRAFLCAAIHYYDQNGEPQWPYTPGQIGRVVTPSNFVQVITAIMQGSQQNAPQSDEVKPASRPTTAGDGKISPAGGLEFGPSDEDVLGSLTMKSAS